MSTDAVLRLVLIVMVMASCVLLSQSVDHGHLERFISYAAGLVVGALIWSATPAIETHGAWTGE